MSVTRWLAAGAALLILTGVVSAAQEIGLAPGPLEKRANAITPENPIPRRTYSPAPIYPAEAQAIDGAATVTMVVTLDEAGRVAEVRRGLNPIVRPLGGTPASATALESAGEALVRSAAAALWQWQYDAPAKGPISFDVTFLFRPGGEATNVQGIGGRGGLRLGGPAPAPAGAAAGTPLPPWEAAKGAVRVGGNIRPPVQTRRVGPAYPADARDARVQGVVILEAVIGPDGTVREVRVLRSIPALDQAAIDAVKQWEYEPTMLNGVPVPVIMTVTVQFTLG